MRCNPRATAPPESIRLLAGVDVLLGRRTYESFRSVWPTADHRMAPDLNALPRVVCSTSLDEAPWGEHEPGRVVRDGVAWARGHRAGDGRISIVWGSVALVRPWCRPTSSTSWNCSSRRAPAGRAARVVPG